MLFSCNQKLQTNHEPLEKNQKLIISKLDSLKDNCCLMASRRDFLTQLRKTEDFNNEQLLEVLIPINCDTDLLQAFHLDLVNQFGILGKVKLNKSKNEIEEINLKIQEIAGKDRYDLISAEYVGETTDILGTITHHFNINIEKGNSVNIYKKVKLNALKMMKKGDKIDFHIKSEDCRINTYEYKDDTCPTMTNDYKILTKFGNTFCRGIVTNP